MPLSTVSRGASARSAWAALPGWSRPSRPIATSASRPGELMHVDVKKLGRFARPGHRVTGARRSQAGNAGRGGLGVRARLRRRRHPPGLRRSARTTSAAHDRRRLPARAVAWFAAHGITRRAGDDRQRRPPTARTVHAPPAARSGSATCAPGPTGRAPTARPSASSRRCCARWAYGRLYGTSEERTSRARPLARPLQLPQTTRQPQPQAARSSPRRAEQRG